MTGSAYQRRDTVIFFNFRPDRARSSARAFIEPDFDDFDREGRRRK